MAQIECWAAGDSVENCKIIFVMPKKVIVVGAGLVGGCAALALKKLGMEVVIYDKADVATADRNADGTVNIDFGEVGGALGIQANGLLALDRLGLLDKVLEQPHTLPDGMHYAKADGSDPVLRSMIQLGVAEKFTRPVAIMRSNLHGVIFKACQSLGIRTFISKKLVSLEQTDEQVTCNFADGSSATADYVVAADGIHSVTRQTLFPEFPKADFWVTGYLGVFDLNKEVGDEKLSIPHPVSACVDGFTGTMVFSQTLGQHRGVWTVTLDKAHSEQPAEDDLDSWRPYTNLPKESARLASLVSEWGTPQQIVSCVRHANRITPVHMYDLPNIPKYSKGRVVIVGDAAHGMLPTLGYGISQGLEDVIALSDLFEEFGEDNYKTVFNLYEKIRIPRAHKVQDDSRAISATMFSSTKFKAAVGRQIMKTVFWLSKTFRLVDPVSVYDVKADIAKVIQEQKALAANEVSG
ncbi:hypothetical protein HDU84_008535 [Entophlyctis sp. JEL0112]|nr:hypothetical protein HDU84_008535 [Entophlyctis sp. JEL0112]